ncbi:MAG: hypothetical protein IKY63_04410 [Tidjanibacter sp.]|nr:hypothetical protein [Tidjanibacter sp.]
MKKIFHILMSAVVALGVVACDNEIDDNLGGTSGESVSIYVSIEQPTKVDFTGETDPVKGAKIGFEEGDELYVVNGWADSTEEGYYFTYAKQEGDVYKFVCDTPGVSKVLGAWKGIYYLGGRKQAIGAYGNTVEESVNGVFMHGAGTVDGSTPIALSTSAILKFKSDDPVTITSSSSAFYNNGSTSTYTTRTTGEYIYLPLTRYSGEYTFTFSIKGKEIGKKTLTLAPNKIYNFGYLETPAEEVADGDPAGIAITINGDFADWNNITKNVVTDASSTMKTVKAYADANNVYVYAEMKPTSPTVHFGVFLDLDADPTTGGKYSNNGITRYGEANIQAQCIYNSEIIEYAWGGNYTYNSDGTQLGTFTFTGAKPVRTDDGSMYVELAIPFAQIPELKSKNIGVIAYVQDNYATSGMLPAEGYLVIPAVE